MGTTGSAGAKFHSEGMTSKNSEGIDSKNRAVDMPRPPISTEAATLNDEAVNSPTLLTQGCDSISVRLPERVTLHLSGKRTESLDLA